MLKVPEQVLGVGLFSPQCLQLLSPHNCFAIADFIRSSLEI